MTGFEEWSHLAGFIVGCVVIAFALALLFVREPAPPEPDRIPIPEPLAMRAVAVVG